MRVGERCVRLVAPQRLNAILFGSFAVLALVIAALGLVLGGVASFILTRLMAGMLFEVNQRIRWPSSWARRLYCV